MLALTGYGGHVGIRLIRVLKLKRMGLTLGWPIHIGRPVAGVRSVPQIGEASHHYGSRRQAIEIPTQRYRRCRRSRRSDVSKCSWNKSPNQCS
jgi:hypothetical protein